MDRMPTWLGAGIMGFCEGCSAWRWRGGKVRVIIVVNDFSMYDTAVGKIDMTSSHASMRFVHNVKI